MRDTTIETTLSVLVDGISSHLDTPDDTSRKLQAITERVNGLSDRIGSKAQRDAIQAITEALADCRRARLADITAALVEACKPLGINLVAKPPAKRVPKKRRQRRKPPALPADVAIGSFTAEDKR